MVSVAPEMAAFLLVAGFVAAFIDSVVGGGGMISLPALLLTGIPPSVALGTNKLASTMASLTSSLSFIRSGKVNMSLIKYLFPLSFFGSMGGAYLVQHIPSHFLKPLVIVLLVLVTTYTIFKKEWGKTSTYEGMTQRNLLLGALAAAGLGFYDGFFGPGAGAFLLFAFLGLGFDFVQAAGNARVLNFASNIAAIITFLLLGSVHYLYGCIMGIGMIVGAILGTRVAVTRGAAYVRPLFIFVTAVLIGKQLWDVLH